MLYLTSCSCSTYVCNERRLVPEEHRQPQMNKRDAPIRWKEHQFDILGTWWNMIHNGTLRSDITSLRGTWVQWCGGRFSSAVDAIPYHVYNTTSPVITVHQRHSTHPCVLVAAASWWKPPQILAAVPRLLQVPVIKEKNNNNNNKNSISSCYTLRCFVFFSLLRTRPPSVTCGYVTIDFHFSAWAARLLAGFQMKINRMHMVSI